jgi:hypothetical protein
MCPGIDWDAHQAGMRGQRNLNDETMVNVDAELAAGTPIFRGQSNYIKLHGSLNWRSRHARLMVTGGNKEQRIANTALFNFYQRVFVDVLNFHDNGKLFVIGYSFGDNHINEIIAAAIARSGLRLMILDPLDPDSLRKRIFASHMGREIWEAAIPLCYRLTDLLPPIEHQDVSEWRAITDAFFDRAVQFVRVGM